MLSIIMLVALTTDCVSRLQPFMYLNKSGSHAQSQSLSSDDD